MSRQENDRYIPELQEEWRKGLRIPIRAPKAEHQRVLSFLRKCWPPNVFLRESPRTTDIVIRLPSSSKTLEQKFRQAYFGSGLTLKQAFEEILWRASGEKQSTWRWKLASLGYKAYQQAWAHLFRLLYVDQFHPAVNPPSWWEDFERSLQRSPGRRKKEEQKRLMARFSRALLECQKLHKCVSEAVARELRKGTKREQIPRLVLTELWKKVVKMPGGVSILGGEVFLQIPYGRQQVKARMEDPSTWQPKQLAIALVALEREQTYEYIQRRIASMRPSSSAP